MWHHISEIGWVVLVDALDQAGALMVCTLILIIQILVVYSRDWNGSRLSCSRSKRRAFDIDWRCCHVVWIRQLVSYRLILLRLYPQFYPTLLRLIYFLLCVHRVDICYQTLGFPTRQIELLSICLNSLIVFHWWSWWFTTTLFLRYFRCIVRLLLLGASSVIIQFWL